MDILEEITLVYETVTTIGTILLILIAWDQLNALNRSLNEVKGELIWLHGNASTVHAIVGPAPLRKMGEDE
jgi:hypothetical protein